MLMASVFNILWDSLCPDRIIRQMRNIRATTNLWFRTKGTVIDENYQCTHEEGLWRTIWRRLFKVLIARLFWPFALHMWISSLWLSHLAKYKVCCLDFWHITSFFRPIHKENSTFQISSQHLFHLNPNFFCPSSACFCTRPSSRSSCSSSDVKSQSCRGKFVASNHASPLSEIFAIIKTMLMAIIGVPKMKNR